MFILFCILQTFVIGFGWIVLIWLWMTASDLLVISSYPIIDFAMKTDFTKFQPVVPQTRDDNQADVVLNTALDDSAIRKLFKEERIRSLTTSER